MRSLLRQQVMVEEGFELRQAHCNYLWPVIRPPGKRTKRLEVTGNWGGTERRSPQIDPCLKGSCGDPGERAQPLRTFISSLRLLPEDLTRLPWSPESSLHLLRLPPAPTLPRHRAWHNFYPLLSGLQRSPPLGLPRPCFLSEGRVLSPLQGDTFLPLSQCLFYQPLTYRLLNQNDNNHLRMVVIL